MTRLGRILRDTSGAMMVETALTLPFLLMLALGGYQVSLVVARQSELETAAGEAQQIVLATKPRTSGELTTISSILQTSTGLASSKVDVSFRYRCGTDTTLSTSSGSCSNTTQESAYVRIALTDTYVPTWTKFGVGSNVNFSVIRMAQES
jgi:Flp pilus assembly protein TadG